MWCTCGDAGTIARPRCRGANRRSEGSHSPHPHGHRRRSAVLHRLWQGTECDSVSEIHVPRRAPLGPDDYNPRLFTPALLQVPGEVWSQVCWSRAQHGCVQRFALHGWDRFEAGSEEALGQLFGVIASMFHGNYCTAWNNHPKGLLQECTRTS